MLCVYLGALMSNILFKGTAAVITGNPPFIRGMPDSQEYTLTLYMIQFVEEILFF